MSLKARMIPCLDVKDGRTCVARSATGARTRNSMNRRGMENFR